ncbi:MAG TPA: hypothetical protein VLM85_30540 [Polyangiaceae bacterium]|nr:hypothetical protein [Polyangiaceae bacterium]
MKKLFVMAGAIVLLDLVLRWIGADADTSVIAGMPRSAASYVLGPLFVLVSLASVTVAPILAIAAASGLVFHYLSAAWRARVLVPLSRPQRR